MLWTPHFKTKLHSELPLRFNQSGTIWWIKSRIDGDSVPPTYRRAVFAAVKSRLLQDKDLIWHVATFLWHGTQRFQRDIDCHATTIFERFGGWIIHWETSTHRIFSSFSLHYCLVGYKTRIASTWLQWEKTVIESCG